MNMTQSAKPGTLPVPPKVRKQSGWSGFCKNMRQNKLLLIMCLPAIVFFFIFSYVPMPGIFLAFVDYKYNLGILGIFTSPFVGFKNFEALMANGKIWILTRNTVLYNLVFLTTNNIMQIAVALMLNEIASRWFRKVSQTIMLLPHFISWVVVGVFAGSLLNTDKGIINSLIRASGGEGINFYANPAYWPWILTFVNLWKGIGYGSIVYFAAIMGIDAEIMEAAAIDGANAWQRIRHIMLPLLKNTFIMLLLFSVGGILRGNFGMFYNIVGASNAVLQDSTDIIETFVFRALMNNFNFSQGSAVSLYQSLFGCLLVMASNALVRRLEPDAALF